MANTDHIPDRFLDAPYQVDQDLRFAEEVEEVEYEAELDADLDEEESNIYRQ